MNRKDFFRPGEGKRKPLLYKACGLEGIYLLNGYKVEKHDGETFTFVEGEDDLHRAIGLYLVTERKGLSGKEFRFLRNVLGMTQAELAKALGTTSQTLARWEKEACEIPGPAEKLLRLTFILSQMPRETLQQLVEDLKGEILKKLEALDDADESVEPVAHFSFNDGWKEQHLACA